MDVVFISEQQSDIYSVYIEQYIHSLKAVSNCNNKDEGYLENTQTVLIN